MFQQNKGTDSSSSISLLVTVDSDSKFGRKQDRLSRKYKETLRIRSTCGTHFEQI